MESAIHSVEIVEGLVEITVSKLPADGKFPIRYTPGAAEIWAREILACADKLKRADIENLLASLKRQAQQVQASLDRAEAQLRAMDGGNPTTAFGEVAVTEYSPTGLAVKSFTRPRTAQDIQNMSDAIARKHGEVDLAAGLTVPAGSESAERMHAFFDGCNTIAVPLAEGQRFARDPADPTKGYWELGRTLPEDAAPQPEQVGTPLGTAAFEVTV
jgi:hypothetical protein